MTLPKAINCAPAVAPFVVFAAAIYAADNAPTAP
jgi:hypothetical protein